VEYQRLQQYFGDGYLHVGELGNVNIRAVLFRSLILLRELRDCADVITSKSVVLLCVCYAARKCHRNEVANILSEAFGLEKFHISMDQARRE